MIYSWLPLSGCFSGAHDGMYDSSSVKEHLSDEEEALKWTSENGSCLLSQKFQEMLEKIGFRGGFVRSVIVFPEGQF